MIIDYTGIDLLRHCSLTHFLRWPGYLQRHQPGTTDLQHFATLNLEGLLLARWWRVHFPSTAAASPGARCYSNTCPSSSARSLRESLLCQPWGKNWCSNKVRASCFYRVGIGCPDSMFAGRYEEHSTGVAGPHHYGSVVISPGTDSYSAGHFCHPCVAPLISDETNVMVNWLRMTLAVFCVHLSSQFAQDLVVRGHLFYCCESAIL